MYVDSLFARTHNGDPEVGARHFPPQQRRNRLSCTVHRRQDVEGKKTRQLRGDVRHPVPSVGLGTLTRSTRHHGHHAEPYPCLILRVFLRRRPPARPLRDRQPQPVHHRIAGLADAAWAWAYEVADLVSANVSRTKSATSMVPRHRDRLTRRFSTLLFHGEGHAAAWVYGFVVLPH